MEIRPEPIRSSRRLPLQLLIAAVLLSLAHLQWRLVVLLWTMRVAGVVFVALMFARWWHRRRRHA